MRMIRAGALEVGLDERGEGPPLILLHGATSAGREDFAAQVPVLARSFRVLLPDARGHATTRWDVADGFQHRWLVDDLAALLDALELERVHLLGFSMGGLTALWFASRHPERVISLVAAGISPQREPRTSVARRLMDPERIERRDPAWAARLARRHDPWQGEGAWRRLLVAIAADVGHDPPLEPRDLRRITMPTLVAAGDRDPFVPVDHAWGLMRQLPDARLFIAPSCGHEIIAQRPGLFNDAVTAFHRSIGAGLDGHDARRAASSGPGVVDTGDQRQGSEP
jgi:pimeloyl-ACP methyl ester carboxylesterase